MKKGFTLLELIVVIVILGILATLATTQYSRMVEKSRGAEARIVIGAIRTNQAAIRLQNGACTSTPADVGIAAGSDAPSPCTITHYFSYSLPGAAGNSFTAVATRCTVNGKSPDASTAGTVTLITDFDTGSDAWTTSSAY